MQKQQSEHTDWSNALRRLRDAPVHRRPSDSPAEFALRAAPEAIHALNAAPCPDKPATQ